MLPFTAWKNPNPYLITTGASFGAYHAVCFGFRHPDRVNRIIGMSGLYDMKRLTGGYSDANVYAANPQDFIRHEHDPARLDALRRQDIILAIGRDDPACEDNRALSAALWEQGHRQRAPDLGRVGPRLAVLGADDPAVHRGARLTTAMGQDAARMPNASDSSSAASGRSRRRFIEEVSRRDAGRRRPSSSSSARTAMDEPCRRTP